MTKSGHLLLCLAAMLLLPAARPMQPPGDLPQVFPTNDPYKLCSASDPGKAIIACTSLIEARDTNAKNRSMAFANRANAYLNRGDSVRALADLDKALMLDSRNPVALAARGSYYHAQGDDTRATQDFNSAVSENPRDISALLQRGNFFLLNREPQ